MREVSVNLGRPAKLFFDEPVIPDDLEPYFFAYLDLKGRASTFSGILSWRDIYDYADRVAPYLDLDIFLPIIQQLEREDDELTKARQEADRAASERKK